MKKITIFVFLVIILFLIFNKKDSYVGFFYPDPSNLTYDVMSKEDFPTIEECRVWVSGMVLEYAQEVVDNGGYDYECGRNCKIKGVKPYTCKETLR